MSSPVTSLSTVSVSSGALSGYAQSSDYTLSSIGDAFQAGISNIQKILHGTSTDGSIPPIPDLSSPSAYMTLSNGSELNRLNALNYILTIMRNLYVQGDTVTIDEASGTQKTYFMTTPMAEHLDVLFRMLQLLGVNVSNNTSVPVNLTLDQAKALQNISAAGMILDPLFAYASTASSTNRSFQAMVELDFVKSSNDMLGAQLASLEQALSTTKGVLDDLASLQNLHNLLSVTSRGSFSNFFNLAGTAGQTAAQYEAAYKAAADAFFNQPISPLGLGIPPNTEYLASIPPNSYVMPGDTVGAFNPILNGLHGIPPGDIFTAVLQPTGRYNIINGFGITVYGDVNLVYGNDTGAGIIQTELNQSRSYTFLASSIPVPSVYVDASTSFISSTPVQWSTAAEPFIKYNILGTTQGTTPTSSFRIFQNLPLNDFTAPSNPRAEVLWNDWFQAKSLFLQNITSPNILGVTNASAATIAAINYFNTRFQFLGGGNPIVPINTTNTATGPVWLTGTGQVFSAADSLKFVTDLRDIRTSLLEHVTILSAITPKRPDGSVDPDTLLARIKKVITDIPLLNSGSMATDLTAARTWLLDNYGSSSTVNAGTIQQGITFAITSGQSLNDQQKESVRRFLFIFEEYYKAAAAILQQMTQMIERMAQGIAR